MKKILTLILFIIAFTYYSNNAIEVTEYTYTNSKWPKTLDGYKIVHLSDLHNKSFGENQKYILKKIEDLSPDLIIMTGDLIDRRHYAKEPAIDLMKGCVDIAPTAYVTGNHEIMHGSAESVMNELRSLDVIVLNNEALNVSTPNGSYTLTGIADREAFMNQSEYEAELKRLANDSNINILLSHRPEQFETYVRFGYNLAFSGHSHGGQIRLPFLGGLVAPQQGWLPKYDGGRFKDRNTTMIVSRGLGNSIMPLRIFNQPEIPVLTLYSK